MEKAILKEIALKQADFSKKTRDNIIEREILVKVEEFLKLPHSIIISGIRRVGKSTLLAQIMQKFFNNDAYYFNFEDEQLINFEDSDFNQLFEVLIELFGKKKVFFLDEIQNVKGWENFIRRMQDEGYKFFITGSNASLLGKELGTKLTGRHINLELYPFSFREFIKFQKYPYQENDLLRSEKRAELKRLFNEYMKFGGMPEYLQFKNKEILKKVYDDILYRDIAARYELKEIKALRELGLYLFSNISCPFSYNNLKNYLSLGSANTVKSYVDYLENSYLIFELNKYAYSVKQQIMGLKKVYSIDNALTNEIAFGFSENKGRYLENLVFQELKRRNQEIYFYRSKGDLEIDFVVREGVEVKSAIQVSFDLNEKSKDREIESMLAGLEELNLKNGLILTDNFEDKIKKSGREITILPVYKWLIEG